MNGAGIGGSVLEAVLPDGRVWPPSRSSLLSAAILGTLAAGWVTAVVVILVSSGDPNGYFWHRMGPRYGFSFEFTYPVAQVRTALGVVFAEVGFFLLLVRPWRFPLRLSRAALAFAGLVAWFFLTIRFALRPHATPYEFWHKLWLAGLVAFSGLVLAATVLSRACRGAGRLLRATR